MIAFIIALVVFFILVGLFCSVEYWSNDDKRILVHSLLGIGVVAVSSIIISIIISQCNRRDDFNDKAKICGLGYYDNDTRITAVLDSLCCHNCVRFGELLTDKNKLRDRYYDSSASNDYIVGCRDIISGDVLEIELNIIWTGNKLCHNKIAKITLKNANGIAKSGYSIDPAYLSGGSGFEKGYCAEVSDTCAMIFEK